MNILETIRQEQKRVQKQLGKLQHRLSGLDEAANALRNSAGKGVTRARKRVMSAAGRAKISRAAKKRWAAFRTRVKKVAG